MNKILVASLLLFLPAIAFAQGYSPYGDGYGMMWGGNSGSYLWGWLFGLVCFAIFSFVFSVIFWLVHNWINKK